MIFRLIMPEPCPVRSRKRCSFSQKDEDSNAAIRKGNIYEFDKKQELGYTNSRGNIKSIDLNESRRHGNC